MRNLIYTFCFLAGLLSLQPGEVDAQDPPLNLKNSDEIATYDFRSIGNNAFTVGEKLQFDIYWEIAHVGSAYLWVSEKEKLNGRDVYVIESRAQSNKVISSFYRVDDRITSYTDADGLFSHRLEKHIREGKYRTDRLFLFDQINNIAIDHRDTVDVPAYCQDILSAFYYVRTLDLEVGQTIKVPNFDNGKVYDITVDVLRTQKVRVPAGTFDTIVVQPTLESGALFKNEGRVQVFLTDDEKKIPVLMVTKIVMGEVAAKLTKIERQ